MGEAWRDIDGRLAACFAAPSHAAGASLAEAGAGRGVDLDVRARCVRVTVAHDDAGLAPTIDAAARAAGLSPESRGLQTVRLVLETPDPDRIADLWMRGLGYERHGDVLRDPARRALDVRLVRDPEVRPLRDRIHLDVVRPPDAITALVDAVGAGMGPWGVRHADADGTELDAVPGDRLDGASDWWTLFAATARYAAPSPAAAAALVREAARIADDAGEPLGIDLRGASVTLATAKDAWEDDDGARPAFVAVAAAIQRVARALGAASDTTGLRFVQLGLDAVDVAAARATWGAILAAEPDPRAHVTDLVDPLGLGHVLFVQPMDAFEHDRRAQRPRVRLDVLVPADALDARADAVADAGGRVLDRRDGRVVVADAEGAIATLVAVRAG